MPHARTNADHALALMRRAARAFSADPFQKGFLVELPPEGDVMVTGDLHGNFGNLRRIIKLANLPRYGTRHLVLQELVHEIESDADTCRSFRLVETAARLKAAFPSQVHILLGNHEFAEVVDLAIGKKGRELNIAFDEGLRAVYGDHWEKVKGTYRAFWRRCPLAVRTPNRIFISHSTPRLGKMNDLDLEYFRNADPEDVFSRNGPVFPMLWGRDHSAEAAEEFARRVRADVLIVGHMPCDEGVAVPNRRHLILDCKDIEGRYALLPLDAPLGHAGVLARVRKLYD